MTIMRVVGLVGLTTLLLIQLMMMTVHRPVNAFVIVPAAKSVSSSHPTSSLLPSGRRYKFHPSYLPIIIDDSAATTRTSSSSSTTTTTTTTALSIGRLKKMFGGGTSGASGDGDSTTGTTVVEKEEGVTTTTESDKTTTATTTTEEKVVDKDDEDDEEETNQVKKLFGKIKEAGLAGSISLFLWEGAFWAISIPVAIFGYNKVTGHWPDLSDKEDLSQVGAEAFAFANVARLALPVRIGLAISTTPWVQENIVDRFLTNSTKDEE